MKKYQFTEEEKKELESAKGGDKKAFEALSMKYRRRARKEGRFVEVETASKTKEEKPAAEPVPEGGSEPEAVEVHAASESVVISQEG